MKQMRYIAINSYWETLEFQLPPLTDKSVGGWLRIIDTALPCPNDIAEDGIGYPLSVLKYSVKPRSLMMLRRRYS
jgi:glycogen operon protein